MEHIKMKAAVCFSYGPPEVLQIRQVNKPQRRSGELLIRIHATSVNSADWRLRKADPFLIRLFFGLTKPRYPILGVAFAGTVEENGTGTSRFQPGDEVFGLSEKTMGSYAEYLVLAENSALAIKPANLSFEEAACLPFGGHTALHFLKKAGLNQQHSILIYGASGAVGTAAVQMAKYYGARVTGVCSTANLELVRSFGADQVIDYTRKNLAEVTEKYDLVFETVNKTTVPELVRMLKKKGTLILSAAMLKEGLQAIRASVKGYRVIAGEAKADSGAMEFLKDLSEAGNIKVPVDRTFKLEQIVEAHRYVEKGHKKGNVAVTIA